MKIGIRNFIPAKYRIVPLVCGRPGATDVISIPVIEIITEENLDRQSVQVFFLSVRATRLAEADRDAVILYRECANLETELMPAREVDTHSDIPGNAQAFVK